MSLVALLALSGHLFCAAECPLLGGKADIGPSHPLLNKIRPAFARWAVEAVRRVYPQRRDAPVQCRPRNHYAQDRRGILSVRSLRLFVGVY
jgi:hypothetical protein